MKKRSILLLWIILCIGLLPQISALGASDSQASMTLYYQKEGQTFSGLSIGIYRVAEAFPDGTFELIQPYASYPVNIHGITRQEQWNTVAETLYSYILADQVQPDRVEETDDQGMVRFLGLETGLYFVRETVAENASGAYIFNQFMIYLPQQQSDGTVDYEVEAYPKCMAYIPSSQYTVTKLWQDAGNQSSRPKEVTVDIYQDGILQETQVLSAENNWTYTWSVSPSDQGKWSVAERNVPEEYKVTIQQNGSNFSLINTRKTQQDPPKTGDTFSPLPWMMVMAGAGVLLLLLGIYGRRKKA